jgi:hypothetical protein
MMRDGVETQRWQRASASRLWRLEFAARYNADVLTIGHMMKVRTSRQHVDSLCAKMQRPTKAGP